MDPISAGHGRWWLSKVVVLLKTSRNVGFLSTFPSTIMARTWGAPFFPLNHERVDFVPSSLEAIDKTPQPKSGCIAQNKANLVSTFEKNHGVIPCICGKSMKKL